MLRGPVRGDFEHQRVVVADFLYRRHGRRPVDRAVEGDEVIVSTSGVVVDVRRHEMARHRLDRVDEIAVHVCVAEIEADADVERLEVLLDEVDQRRRSRQLIGNHLDGDVDVERRREPPQLLDAAPRPVAAVVAR